MYDPGDTLLRQLTVFITVAEDRQIRKAAERLRLDQSAVSRRINTLEQSIGIELFERRPEGLRLTPAGEILLEEAHRIRRQVQESLDRARSAKEGTAGVLRLGFIERVTRLPFFGPMLSEFEALYPTAKIKLFQMSTPAQIEALRDRTIDVGLLRESQGSMHGIERRRLSEHELLVALPRDHPLAKAPAVALVDLADERFLWPPRDVAPRIATALEEAFAERGLRPNVMTEIGTSLGVVAMVASKQGVGFVDAAALHYDASAVVLKPISDFKVPIAIDIAWSQINPSPLLPRFLDHALNVMGRQDGYPDTASRVG